MSVDQGQGQGKGNGGEKKSFGKPFGKKPGAGRPAGAEGKSFGKRSGSAPFRGKAADGSAGGQKTERRFGKPAGAGAAGKPAEMRTFGKKPAGAAGGSKSTEKKPFGRPAGAGVAGKPAERKPFGKPAGAGTAGKPAEKKPFGSKPAGAPTRGKPSVDRSGAKSPAGARPSAGPRPFASKYPARGKPISKPSAPVQTTGLSVGARRIALDVLRDVRQKGAYAQLALNEKLSASRLSPADKRLVTSIVYGTLENQIRIDFALDQFMERPTHDPSQRDILRLSACQILFHDRVPDSAAVNEGVNLAKGIGMEASAGFFNAVLRNLSRGKNEINWPKKEDDLPRYLHIMGSMPDWIVERLLAAYGEEEAERLILYRETGHPVALRPNLLRISDSDFEALLEKKGWCFRKGLAPHAYLVTGAESLGIDAEYRDGLYSIQGQSSMLAAEAVQVKPGMRILDACAAPGGKSAYLCEKMQGTGRVFAWELHEKRAMLLESAKRRLGLDNLRISVRDATEPKPDLLGTLDAVLLDAPCSGLGVMAQKPDLKFRVKDEDIEPITAQQRRLLEALCGYVKPNGLLVYSTCSILPEENEEQIRAFLAAHPEFSIEPLPLSFPEELRKQQNALGLQLLGYRDDVEGFYIARLRRAGAKE